MDTGLIIEYLRIRPGAYPRWGRLNLIAGYVNNKVRIQMLGPHGSTVVEHSTHNPEIQGSISQEKMINLSFTSLKQPIKTASSSV